MKEVCNLPFMTKHSKPVVVLVVFMLCIVKSFAQDSVYARHILDTLTSSAFWGRGYTKNGMKKASLFLEKECKQLGLKPISKKSFLQPYSYSVNIFPDKMQLSINGKPLEAGKDFIVSAESKGIQAAGNFEQKDSITFIDRSNSVIVKIQDKLTMTVAGKVEDYTLVQVDKKSLGSLPQSYTIAIDNKLEEKFKASNICGIVKGTRQPDSFIVITAHYDHLGGLGKDVYFPGANDNASGVSLLLSLAKYYAKHPRDYSVVFILFSGEEAGLLGSKYFTENPLLPLNKIRFLINTDLAGTGVDGITVVNATEFPKEFGWMQNINKEFRLLKAVNPRGKAHNSDHYYFTEKGVPSFFLYTLGGIKAYHDVFDVAATLPMTEYNDLFTLIIKFNERLMQ